MGVCSYFRVHLVDGYRQATLDLMQGRQPSPPPILNVLAADALSLVPAVPQVPSVFETYIPGAQEAFLMEARLAYACYKASRSDLPSYLQIYYVFFLLFHYYLTIF